MYLYIHTHTYIYLHIHTYIHNTIYMYSGITSGRVLNGELLYPKILEVNLFAFAYRQMQTYIHIYTKILEVNLFAFAYRLFRRDFSTKQSVGKCKQINF